MAETLKEPDPVEGRLGADGQPAADEIKAQGLISGGPRAWLRETPATTVDDDWHGGGHWSLPWSDLMMVMFVLFAILMTQQMRTNFELIEAAERQMLVAELVSEPEPEPELEPEPVLEPEPEPELEPESVLEPAPELEPVLEPEPLPEPEPETSTANPSRNLDRLASRADNLRARTRAGTDEPEPEPSPNLSLSLSLSPPEPNPFRCPNRVSSR